MDCRTDAFVMPFRSIMDFLSRAITVHLFNKWLLKRRVVFEDMRDSSPPPLLLHPANLLLPAQREL